MLKPKKILSRVEKNTSVRNEILMSSIKNLKKLMQMKGN